MPRITTISVSENSQFELTAIPVAATEEDSQLPVSGDIPTWGTSDATIATVTPSADGTSANVTTLHKAGVVTIHVQAQTMPFGPTFSSSLAVTVTAPPANHFEFLAGPIPPVPAP